MTMFKRMTEEESDSGSTAMVYVYFWLAGLFVLLRAGWGAKDDSRMTLIADTLRLFANGDVTRTTVYETIDESVPPHSVVQRVEFNGRYLIDGIQLKVASPCGESALCGPGPVIGTITSARVTLATSQLGDNSGQLVFRRIE